MISSVNRISEMHIIYWWWSLQGISIQDLKLLHNINILDIRAREKYNDNHIPNAINIFFQNLLVNPQKYLNKNEKYYIYCQKGIKGKRLCSILTKKGYNVVNIDGGYEAWILNR